MRLEDYAIRIEPLPVDKGGGVLVTVPDLLGCMADGETIEQAVAEARDAFKARAMAERQDNGRLPAPNAYSGQFAQRIPKGLHRRLATCAATAGVSFEPAGSGVSCGGAGVREGSGRAWGLRIVGARRWRNRLRKERRPRPHRSC